MLSHDRLFSLFALTLTSSTLDITVSAADTEYEEWETYANQLGYSWEPYVVTTDDGWYLTVMRITAVNGVELSKQEENKDKPPVLAMHGATMDGVEWLSPDNNGNAGLPGALAEQGYDVWVGNSRGTPYSNNNIGFEPETWWTWEKHWDFTWAEMGDYDIPALVNKMIEVTEKPKVTLMGFSQGGAQMFYALAHNQDFYADKVHRFVSLNGCPYPALEQSYDESVTMFKDLYERGIYNYGGGDEHSYDEDDLSMNGWAVKTEMYDQQIAVAGRLQEPISLDAWTSGELYSTEIFMEDIDRVPVSIMHTYQDNYCKVDTLKYAYSAMTVKEKYIMLESGGHGHFGSASQVKRVAETIEYGQPIPNVKYASCEIEDKDGNMSGLSGTMLFQQRKGKPMYAIGILEKEDKEIEQRYLGVNNGVAEGTCSAQEGSNWPFDGTEDQNAFKQPLKFFGDGYALARSKVNASLYGDDSIIGKSLSIHSGMDKTDYDINACCTITQMLKEDGSADNQAYKKAKNSIKSERRKIQRARRGRKLSEDDDFFQ